ncbi:MAG: hypothetical protein V3S49_02615, partial [Thermodesulfobacteriota bacterium]
DDPARKYLSPLILIPYFAFSVLIGSPSDFITPLTIQYLGANGTTSYAMLSLELQEMYWGLCMFLAAILIYWVHRRQVYPYFERVGIN